MAISFKPYYKSDNLIGEGTVKFRPYSGIKMTTLKAGIYKWKDDTPLYKYIGKQNILFNSNSETFTAIEFVGGEGGLYYRKSDGTNIIVYDDYYGWGKTNTAYQTITLYTDQQVSAEFYTWAIDGGNLVRESAAGTWLLNTTLIRPQVNQTYKVDVNVAYDNSNTFTAKYMNLYKSGYVLRFEHYEPEYGEDEARNFYYTKSGDYNSGSTSGNYSLYVAISNVFDTVNEFIRTFTITGGADIYNPDLIAWLKANAVKQS